MQPALTGAALHHLAFKIVSTAVLKGVAIIDHRCAIGRRILALSESFTVFIVRRNWKLLLLIERTSLGVIKRVMEVLIGFAVVAVESAQRLRGFVQCS